MQLLHIVLLHMVYNRQKNAKKSFCHSCREIMKIRAEKLCNFRKIVQFRRPPVRCRQCSQGGIEKVEKNLLQVGKRQSFTRHDTQSQQIVCQSRRNPRVNPYRATENPNQSNRLRFHSQKNLAQVQVQVVLSVPQGGSNISRSSTSGSTSISSRFESNRLTEFIIQIYPISYLSIFLRIYLVAAMYYKMILKETFHN